MDAKEKVDKVKSVLPTIEIVSQSDVFQMMSVDSQASFQDYSSATSINSVQIINSSLTQNPDVQTNAVFFPAKLHLCDGIDETKSQRINASTYSNLLTASKISVQNPLVYTSENSIVLPLPVSLSTSAIRTSHSNNEITKDLSLATTVITTNGFTTSTEMNDDATPFESKKSSCRKYISVSTHEEVEEAIRKHAEETYSHFVVAKKTKAYGSLGSPIDIKSKFRIHWQSRDLSSTEECAVQIAFDGIPFVYIGEKAYMCHLGRNRSPQLKNHELGNLEDVRRLHRSKMSKKQGCHAKIFVKQIAKFPQFQILTNSEYLRNQASQKMRKALLENEGDIEHIVQYIATLPDVSEHCNHNIGKDVKVKEPIDSLIRDKILELSWQYGEDIPVRNIKEILEDYVENTLFKGKPPPSRNRRRFYPNEKDISNYIYKSKTVGKLSVTEQANLKTTLSKFSTNTDEHKFCFSFEPAKEEQHKSSMSDNSAQIFYFSYQTENQQRLLKKYGNQVVLTELSKQTINLPFPYYGVFVPTNVDYQLVFSFVTQSRGKDDLKQAILPLLSWNPNWKPRFLVVDFSKEQIAVAEELFPGATVLISDVSREQSWKIWLNNPVNVSNLCGDKDEVYSYLDALANSYTEDSLNMAADVLESSNVWKSSDGLREWFSTAWLSEAKRWVVGYRHEEFTPLLHFRHTLSEEKESMRETHYIHLKQKRLSDFINDLVEKVVPNSFTRYIERNHRDHENLSKLLRNNETNLPSFLWNCSYTLACHVMEQMETLRTKEFQVTKMQPGLFWLQNKKEEHITYVVSFGDSRTLPSCVCLDWLKYRLPCLHMIAIFSVTSWSWDMLSVLYTSNPIYSNESCFADIEKQYFEKKRNQSKSMCADVSDSTTNDDTTDAEICALKFQCGKLCDEIMENCSKTSNKNLLKKMKIDLQVALNDARLSNCYPEKLNRTPMLENGYKRGNVIKEIIIQAKHPKRETKKHSTGLPVETRKNLLISNEHSDCWIFDNELNIKLSVKEKELISNGAPLNDNIMKNIRSILTHQFKETLTLEKMNSLKDVEDNMWFNIQFFHIHQTENQHFAASVKQANSKVIHTFICSNFSKERIKNDLNPLFMKVHAARDENILFIEKTSTIIDGDNLNECGLFAVANVVSFAFNNPLKVQNFLFSKMRVHLIECLEDMCFSMFPMET